MNGFVLAGTSSGVGKTVATLATIRTLEDAGYDVQPAKAGPDFIDPSHHEAVASRPSRTLDPWLEGVEGMRRNYHRGEGDVCVVEGMMGLYDGDASSTAGLAEALDLPVVLVVDAAAGMESVAATALGFRRYAELADRDVEVAGIVAQRAHGGRHEDGIRNALPEDLAYFGRVSPHPDLEIPDRHLGLHTGEEAPLEADALRTAANLDVDRLVSLARSPPKPRSVAETAAGGDARIAVASDQAFCFRYPATIERLRERAAVRTFSPVAGDPIPDCDGVYLPGGYPELHAADLSAGGTLAELEARASEGVPVFGECGGLMVMAESLTTVDGEHHRLAGILPADVTMCERYQALDHVELAATRDGLTARAGETLRGHEFHYSRADAATDARFAFEVRRGEGITGDADGLLEYASLGTYAHVHPESGAFDRFLEAVAANGGGYSR
ncbi:cobyrinic acid a,c-diamide synthase [Natronosalvus caseinilyticus]|uniref:cobyrinic acid a,c-diamide synthase n=1 Tax=Natronosalvus caseinilyticus TaxID=2953747 RepID=UPI0028A9D516|nr:cobyrinic acid a,c-diamide synthase [Natronosalvus caseinilyticus]